ncbi:hypothetical protein POVCU1_081140 [Plasmodium ovale curtisi]|uniref:Uncharacterized protein n=1 Tax=Plasmodium ovale curtisi TaxID=864141 RepID=A0A1A8XC96_PLAOA|nr:hypothetical protein POVCU1_081140 [Plasmodium ovale curtisi]
MMDSNTPVNYNFMHKDILHTQGKEGVKNSDQETIFHKSEKRTEFFDMLKNENNNSTNISNHNSKTNKNNEQRDLRFLN